MKRLLLLVLLMLFLGGGGGAAFWWFYLKGDGAAEAAVQPAEPPEFVELAPLIVPVIREGAVTQHLSLLVTLEVAGKGGAKAVEKDKTRLRDAYFSELYSLYGLRIVQDSDNPLPLIKERLALVSDRTLGPGVVRGILVKGLQGRKPRR